MKSSTYKWVTDTTEANNSILDLKAVLKLKLNYLAFILGIS